MMGFWFVTYNSDIEEILVQDELHLKLVKFMKSLMPSHTKKKNSIFLFGIIYSYLIYLNNS